MVMPYETHLKGQSVSSARGPKMMQGEAHLVGHKGRDVDDLAPASRDHMSTCRLRQDEYGLQVHVKNLSGPTESEVLRRQTETTWGQLTVSHSASGNSTAG